MTKDWRIGATLYDVLPWKTIDAFVLAGEQEKVDAARLTIITAISYSPKRRQYQLAMRTPDGRGMTWHAAAAEIVEEPK